MNAFPSQWDECGPLCNTKSVSLWFWASGIFLFLRVKFFIDAVSVGLSQKQTKSDCWQAMGFVHLPLMWGIFPWIFCHFGQLSQKGQTNKYLIMRYSTWCFLNLALGAGWPKCQMVIEAWRVKSGTNSQKCTCGLHEYEIWNRLVFNV